MDRLFSRILRGFQAFPPKFRVLVFANFIDRVGGTMLFPFFALYVTRRFHVGMTEAGLLLGIFGLAGLLGSMVGGALADRFGRKKLIIFGLISSAFGSLGMGLMDNLPGFFGLAAISGLLDIPGMIGPAAAGLVMDNYNPNWVWYLCGLVALVAAVGFYGLHYLTHARFRATAEPAAEQA